MDKANLTQQAENQFTAHAEKIAQYSGLTLRWGRLVGSVIMFNALLFAPICDGITFTARGTIQSKFFHIDETLSTADAFNFEVAVSNCYWHIKLFPVITTNNSFEAKYDGANVYYIHDLAQTVASLKRANQPVADNVATAMVVKGQVPHDPFAEAIGPIWLACASSCYLKAQTNHAIEVMFSRSDNLILFDQAVIQGATWKLDEDSNFVDALEITNDGHILTYKSLDPSYNSAYRVPYDKGFIIAKFEVSAHKHIAGVAFPSSAIFKTFGTKEHGRSNADLRTVSEHRISISDISLQEAKIDDLPPEVPGATSVMDSRFALEKIMPFSYFCDKRMLTDTEVRQLPQFQKAKRFGWRTPTSSMPVSQLSPTGQKRRSVIISLLVAATLLLPAIIFLSKQVKTK